MKRLDKFGYYYDDDDDDDDDDFDGEDLESEEDRESLLFNELAMKQIDRELVCLDNRDLLEFLTWELDRLGFIDDSELVLIGIEFDTQYLLQFYNIREDKTVKTATGAGNIYMLVDGWIMKTLTDLYIDHLYGDLADVYPSDMTDCNMNILIDILDWKKENEIEPIGSKSPEDVPREDT